MPRPLPPSAVRQRPIQVIQHVCERELHRRRGEPGAERHGPEVLPHLQ
uniref:Uncharacterized protein n=1 Tax=Setaria italica TaxID=4555 RepID=K3XTY9_SETIT